MNETSIRNMTDSELINTALNSDIPNIMVQRALALRFEAINNELSQINEEVESKKEELENLVGELKEKLDEVGEACEELEDFARTDYQV